MPATSPQDDLDFIGFVSSIALGDYARSGSTSPFAVIGLEQGAMIVPAEGLVDFESKQEFVNILRYLSIEHGGRRSAFAMEAWTMLSKDPEDVRIMEEISARRGSISEHPNASEVIYIISESDAGLTTCQYRIARSGTDVTLEPAEFEFVERTFPPVSHGMFSNFHVPVDFQSDPAAQQYATEMRLLVPSTLKRVNIVPTGSVN